MTFTVITQISRLSLGILTLVMLICGWSSFRAGLEIDTDLKSLSPSIAEDPLISHTLNKLSENAARQILLVILHPNETTAEDAHESLQALIASNDNIFRYQDNEQMLQDYLEAITTRPFSFLTEEGRQQLQTASDEALLALGKSRLYGSAGAARLIPLQDDPLGFLQDYADAALATLSGPASDDIQSQVLGDQTWFFAVHALELHPNGLDMNAQADVLAALAKIESTLAAQYPGVRVLHSGIFFFAADAAQASRKDISFITTGSALGILLLLLLIFRTFNALLLPIISIVSGILFAFLLCQVLLGSVHILTIVFGASLIGVVIDYSLHYFYFQARAAQANHSQLHRALLLSLLTSVIGYSALSWSGLPALRQVALFSGLGLIYGWLIVVSLGPMLVKKVKLYDRHLHRAVSGVIRGLARIKTVYLFNSIFALAVLLLLLSGFSFSSHDNPRAFFSPNPNLLAEEQQVTQLTASLEPGSLIVIRGETSAAVYEKIAQVETQLNPHQPPLLGVHQFFPSPEQAQENYEINGRLYSHQGLAWEFMAASGFTATTIAALAQEYTAGHQPWLNPGEFFSRHADTLPPLWVEQDRQIYSFLLIPKTVDLAQLRQAVNIVPEADYFSLMEESTAALAQLRHSALLLLILAFALILLLTTVGLRSWRSGIWLLAVPACALIGSALFINAAGIPFTLFHVMALFLVLGLGMDYGIFVAEMRENDTDTLSAITLSAATSLLSFGLLSASQLPAVAAFGLTVLIGNSINFLGSLVLASRYRCARDLARNRS